MSEPTNDTQNWRDRTAEIVERYAPALHALSDTCDWNTGYADGYAQAVAQERARLRAAVEGLDETVTPGDMGWRPVPGSVSRKAVLRLLDPEAEGGTAEGETTT